MHATAPPPLPPTPTAPSAGLTTKPEEIPVPTGSSTYPGLEPYEGNKTAHALEDREPIKSDDGNGKDKPLPTTPGIDTVGTAPSAAAATGVHFTPPATIDTSPASVPPPSATTTTTTSAPASVTTSGGSGWKSGVTGLNPDEVKGVQHKAEGSGSGGSGNGEGNTSPHKTRSSLGSKIKGVFSRHKNT